MIDKVVYVSCTLGGYSHNLRNDTEKMRHIIDQDLALVATYVPTYMTGETSEKGYAATMIANTAHDDTLASTGYEAGFTNFRKWLATGIPDPDPFYFNALQDSSAFIRMRFCVTSHGFMCLVPSLVEICDYVAIFSGIKLPFAVRRNRVQLRQHFELIGSCYSHRMMKGRCWNLVLEFKCKYQQGSEDETLEEMMAKAEPSESSRIKRGVCEFFLWNASSDYTYVRRVLDKRSIILV